MISAEFMSYRNISKCLQYYTAEAINGALLAAQAQGIVAIPDVDALICQVSDREIVCESIGQHVYQVSHGVCYKVGGIRYRPRCVESAATTVGSTTLVETELQPV
jgi:hypothetical protein